MTEAYLTWFSCFLSSSHTRQYLCRLLQERTHVQIVGGLSVNTVEYESAFVQYHVKTLYITYIYICLFVYFCLLKRKVFYLDFKVCAVGFGGLNLSMHWTGFKVWTWAQTREDFVVISPGFDRTQIHVEKVLGETLLKVSKCITLVWEYAFFISCFYFYWKRNGVSLVHQTLVCVLM